MCEFKLCALNSETWFPISHRLSPMVEITGGEGVKPPLAIYQLPVAKNILRAVFNPPMGTDILRGVVKFDPPKVNGALK